MLTGKTVLLGVSGSIAAYKTASLASALKKLHADVHVLMTENAVNFINPMPETFECTAKFRYRQKDVPVTVKVTGDDQLEISYDSASAVTPGQAVVLYDGDRVIGGATIDTVLRNNEVLEYLA